MYFMLKQGEYIKSRDISPNISCPNSFVNGWVPLGAFIRSIWEK
jgi:hypothetical protein